VNAHSVSFHNNGGEQSSLLYPKYQIYFKFYTYLSFSFAILTCAKFICNKMVDSSHNTWRRLVDDQVGIRPTASTTIALTYLIYHVITMLEKCKYVRCLMIDFVRAFDTVDHPILLAKLSYLNLPAFILNWIISFLTRRTQVFKINGVVSSPLSINTSIIQGSWVEHFKIVVLSILMFFLLSVVFVMYVVYVYVLSYLGMHLCLWTCVSCWILPK